MIPMLLQTETWIETEIGIGIEGGEVKRAVK
jgi:hypothetical protein